MTNVTSGVKYSRLGFLIFALVFAVSIMIQTFLAGLAIFTDFSYWTVHKSFVVWFQFIPILMLILSFTGRLPKRFHWQSAGLLLLIVPLQYMSIHISGMGAVHPVIALLLFGLAFHVLIHSWKLKRQD